MNSVVSPGQPIGVLFQAAKDTQSWQATCAGASANAVAVVGPDRPFRHTLGAVILVVGVPGRRLFAPATFVRQHGAAHVFRLNREWQAFDGRASRRFPVSIPAQVTSVLGGSRQSGKVIDVSAGGAAVLVATKPGGRDIELSLQGDGYAARLRASLVRFEKRADRILLHLQFGELTLVQQGFVRSLVSRLAALDGPLRAAS